jgi:hypothetical protein
MVERRRGELGIDRGERDTLPLCERLDLAPSLRHPFVEWKESARETDAQIVIEPAQDYADESIWSNSPSGGWGAAQSSFGASRGRAR